MSTTTSLSVEFWRDAAGPRGGVTAADVDLVIVWPPARRHPCPHLLTWRRPGSARADGFDCRPTSASSSVAPRGSSSCGAAVPQRALIGVEVLRRFLNWKGRNTVSCRDGAEPSCAASDQPGGMWVQLFCMGRASRGSSSRCGSVCPASPIQRRGSTSPDGWARVYTTPPPLARVAVAAVPTQADVGDIDHCLPPGHLRPSRT